MKKGLLLFFVLSFPLQATDEDWVALENCVQRLKSFEKSVGETPAIRQIATLDRRLYFMLEGIQETQSNSLRLKEIIESKRADKLSSYLVSNASVACEKFELALSTYLSGLKKFLFFFFITTFCISIYSAYLFYSLRFALNKPKDRSKHE